MKRAVTTCALTAALLISPLVALPAEAHPYESGFSIGGWFAVGGVHFSLVFGSRGHGHPDYYYRTHDRFAYRGHRCTDRCYIDRRYAYHSIDCPVVGYHLDRFRQRPHLLFRGYAPAPFWHGAYYGDGPHRSWSRHDRDRYWDRYDRRDRYDRQDRYDRGDRWERGRDRYRDRDDRHRGRGRGHDRHRHDDRCGHDWRHRNH